MTATTFEFSALPPLRQALLDLHKAVLDAERVEVERRVGRLTAAEFLQVILRYPRLRWVQPLTELLARLDAAVAHFEDEESLAVLKGSCADAQALIVPPDAGTDFGSRYLELLQDEPSVVLAHANAVRELRQAAA